MGLIYSLHFFYSLSQTLVFFLFYSCRCVVCRSDVGKILRNLGAGTEDQLFRYTYKFWGFKLEYIKPQIPCRILLHKYYSKKKKFFFIDYDVEYI